MKSLAALLVAAAIAVPATASAAPFKEIGKADQAVTFKVKSSTKRWLHGEAQNLAVTSVTINGRVPQVADHATATEYGFGVVIRFYQTRDRFYVRVANATNKTVKIAVAYQLN